MKKNNTPKFKLREMRMGDAKYIAKYLNNWNVLQYLSALPFPYEEKHAREYIEKMKKSLKKKDSADFVLFITVDDKPIGAIGAHKIESGHKAEMGYWLSEEYWGKGIMSKAVKDFLSIIFKKFDLKRVYARAYSSNKGSMRVMEKVGMKFEGIEKKGAFKKDHRLKKDIFYDKHALLITNIWVLSGFSPLWS